MNEGHSVLSHVAFAPGVHPADAYLELCRIVGQLSVFGADARPPELPRYDHDDLGGCFWKVKQYIDALLGDVEEPAYQERPFIGTGLADAGGARIGVARIGLADVPRRPRRRDERGVRQDADAAGAAGDEDRQFGPGGHDLHARAGRVEVHPARRDRRAICPPRPRARRARPTSRCRASRRPTSGPTS